jgi:hypothetical protein
MGHRLTYIKVAFIAKEDILLREHASNTFTLTITT